MIKPEGTGSLMTTPVACDGPLLVTLSVYVTASPALTTDGVLVFRMARSGDSATVVSKLDWLLLGSPSNWSLLTEATLWSTLPSASVPDTLTPIVSRTLSWAVIAGMIHVTCEP